MSKHMPRRSIRVADPLWSRARARAAQEGERLSEVIRRALETYASGGRP